MLSRNLIYTLLICLLSQNLWAQITFDNPITTGTTCSTTVLSDGLRLYCSGEGFITADALPDTPVVTNMAVTVVSSTVPVGVGLGQVLDSNCLSSMLPEATTTWHDCQLCDRTNCYYDEVVTYTSASYILARNTPQYAATIGKKYSWMITPPTAAGQCWEVDITSNNLIRIFVY